ncbi:MAG TPA: transcription-repair coupling factor, partial [Alphaproteobacteria bacterium]|nr:transcription-repair coupling factor [Alphaproteobacteria bacterium]
MAFFAPELEVLQFPAWDVLPYDRVSPNNAIVSRRIDVLTRLLAPAERPRLLLTTVNAFVQRVMPRSALAESSRHHRVGQRVRTEELVNYLVRNGYNRAQTVREPGEFATRGDIVDLFPPGSAEPLRLDFFGDELEAVRSFDPLSQRTTGKLDSLTLKPVAEFFLDEESVARFRTGYREHFGAVLDDDPLYEAVSAGRRHGGMEHWLPLFYIAMESLLDYLPAAAVSLDAQAEEVRDARMVQVNDYYGARQVLMKGQRQPGVPVYKPLPPGLLYMPAEEWDLVLKPRKRFDLSPFAPPEGQANAVDAGGRRGHSFAEERLREDVNLWDSVRAHLTAHHAEARRTVVAAFSTGSRDRIASLLKEHGVNHVATVDDWPEAARQAKKMVAVATLPLETGFVAEGLAVVSEQDILGDRLNRPTRRRRRADKFIQEVSSLNPGDFVVHIDHGVGRYDGLETLTVSGAPHDCLRLVYEGGDKLFVPVENIEVLSRYGSEESNAQLDKLGGNAWQGRKARVKKRLMDMAEELLRIAAARETRQGDVVEAPAGLYEEFAARFPYPETDDQLRAIEEVMGDLSSGKPMDRLVCGDVGFGKTEVALRAAFLAAMSGMQVAVVVPTTLLARQHYNTFAKRFAGLPLRVAQLSRMVTPKEAKLTKDELARGTLDVVIGTHALLAKGIEFKRLGLLIVDEEQHFGVKQKERLKGLRENIHVLTLTATPIPRTLQLALSGVRELSLIATPPVDRLAVRTFVLPYDPLVIREALMREHYRGGQSFYVRPRLEDLPKLQERLKELVPELKVCTAHGRMTASDLEDVMTAFYEGAYDILLATNIIESGLDIPNANTMIVHRADMFGLSQLYQIRGRIGRSKTRGYAYLTHSAGKVLTGVAKSRLHIIETLDQLG